MNDPRHLGGIRRGSKKDGWMLVELGVPEERLNLSLNVR